MKKYNPPYLSNGRYFRMKQLGYKLGRFSLSFFLFCHSMKRERSAGILPALFLYQKQTCKLLIFKIKGVYKGGLPLFILQSTPQRPVCVWKFPKCQFRVICLTVIEFIWLSISEFREFTIQYIL